jgi:hypothetical protein
MDLACARSQQQLLVVRHPRMCFPLVVLLRVLAVVHDLIRRVPDPSILLRIVHVKPYGLVAVHIEDSTRLGYTSRLREPAVGIP